MFEKLAEGAGFLQPLGGGAFAAGVDQLQGVDIEFLEFLCLPNF